MSAWPVAGAPSGALVPAGSWPEEVVGAATCPMDDLVALPNVHWLGMKPYDQVPAYGAGFDVAIMPWLSNDWIRFCNPIKTKEYLALGLPIVSGNVNSMDSPAAAPPAK